MVVLKRIILLMAQVIVINAYGMAADWTEMPKKVEKKIYGNNTSIYVVIEDTIDSLQISDSSLKILIGLSRKMLCIKDYDTQYVKDYKNKINEQKSNNEFLTLKEYAPSCKHHKKCVHFIAEYPLKNFSSASMFEYSGIRKGVVEGTYSLEDNNFIIVPNVYLKVVQER